MADAELGGAGIGIQRPGPLECRHGFVEAAHVGEDVAKEEPVELVHDHVAVHPGNRLQLAERLVVTPQQ